MVADLDTAPFLSVCNLFFNFLLYFRNWLPKNPVWNRSTRQLISSKDRETIAVIPNFLSTSTHFLYSLIMRPYKNKGSSDNAIMRTNITIRFQSHGREFTHLLILFQSHGREFPRESELVFSVLDSFTDATLPTSGACSSVSFILNKKHGKHKISLYDLSYVQCRRTPKIQTINSPPPHWRFS